MSKHTTYLAFQTLVESCVSGIPLNSPPFVTQASQFLDKVYTFEANGQWHPASSKILFKLSAFNMASDAMTYIEKVGYAVVLAANNNLQAMEMLLKAHLKSQWLEQAPLLSERQAINVAQLLSERTHGAAEYDRWDYERGNEIATRRRSAAVILLLSVRSEDNKAEVDQAIEFVTLGMKRGISAWLLEILDSEGIIFPKKERGDFKQTYASNIVGEFYRFFGDHAGGYPALSPDTAVQDLNTIGFRLSISSQVEDGQSNVDACHFLLDKIAEHGSSHLFSHEIKELMGVSFVKDGEHFSQNLRITKSRIHEVLKFLESSSISDETKVSIHEKTVASIFMACGSAPRKHLYMLSTKKNDGILDIAQKMSRQELEGIYAQLDDDAAYVMEHYLYLNRIQTSVKIRPEIKTALLTRDLEM